MSELVNHINYPNDKSQIYCRKENKIITLDQDGKFWDTCQSCPMFSGDYQGMGVECLWKDNDENPPEYVSNPVKELLRVSKNLDKSKEKVMNNE